MDDAYASEEEVARAESELASALAAYAAAEVPEASAPEWKPGGLTVTDVGQTSVRIGWPEAHAAAGINGYRIYLNDETTPVYTASSSAYTYTLSGLQPGTAYQVTLKAYNAAGEGAGLKETIVTLADKTELVKQINDAAARLESTREGNAPGQFPVTARNALKDAVAAAETIAAAAGVTQAQVDSAAAELQQAIDVYNAAQVPPRRTGGEYLSADADLRNLEILTDGKFLALTPAFTPDTVNYWVETEADKAEIRALSSHFAARIILDGNPIPVYGSEVEVPLKEGDNPFELTVRAENFTTKLYTVTIHRKSSEADPGLENPASPPENFELVELNDIAGHWSEEQVKEAVKKGLVSGYPDGSFQPDQPVSREEFTVMLAKALGHKGEADSLSFADRSDIGEWAEDAISWAVQAGVINGYPDRTFGPKRSISRLEMVAMLVRSTNLPVNKQTSGFADSAVIPGWGADIVEVAAANGLVRGREGNRFAPHEPTTRAESVVILLRLLEAAGS